MAQNVINFPVALKQNVNDESTAYGKYFWVPVWPKTLNLKGLINRVAMSQSVYSADIVRGVIEKLTEVMVELWRQGQPVKWDGLGTFTPNVTCEKHGQANLAQALSNGPAYAVQGVTINFKPENSKGEKLTSRALKDLCTFEAVGYYVRTEFTDTSVSPAKQVIQFELRPVDWKEQPQNP